MFFCVQIRLLSRNITMKNIFIEAASNRKQHQCAQNHEVVTHQRVGEKDQEHHPDGGMEEVLGEAHFAPAKMERRIFASIIKKRHKRQHQDGGSHGP